MTVKGLKEETQEQEDITKQDRDEADVLKGQNAAALNICSDLCNAGE